MVLGETIKRASSNTYIILAYTGTKKIMKNVNIFCHSFQKVKPIYYIDSLNRVKYFKPLFLEILMIMAYR